MAQVPSTEDLHEGDGTTTVFQFTFPYLKVTEVFVTVDGVNVPFSMLVGSTSQIQTLTPPPSGSVVRIYRSTLAIKPLHLFAQGVPFLPRYVDENNRQLLYATQEAINDTAVTAAEALVVAEEAKEVAQEASDKVDAAVIESAAQLRDDLEDGTFSPGWSRSNLAMAISTVNMMLDAQKVNIWEFAGYVTSKPNPTDPSTWDWTPAFVAANASVAPNPNPYPNGGRLALEIPLGVYRVTSVEFSAGFEMYGAGGVIKPLDNNATVTYLLKFTNFCKVANVVIDMEYGINYSRVVWVRGRHNHFLNVTIWRARLCWMVGDPAWATTPADGHLGDSENIWTSCETIWSIAAVWGYGQNTILHFNDCLMYSYRGAMGDDDPTNPKLAAWNAIPDITWENWGALIYLNGGCTANFAASTPVMVAHVQPVTHPDYVNSFGRYYCTGTHIETGILFEVGASEAYTSNDTKTKVLTLINCHGAMTGGSANAIYLGDVCAQGVFVDGACDFYGLTHNNLVYSVGDAKVYVHPRAFANITVDFFQALHVRCPVGYDSFCPVNANGSAQALAAAPTVLAMPNRLGTDLWESMAPVWYDASTGIITPRSDMRNVELDVALALQSGTATDVTDIILFVNGAQVDLATCNGQNPRAQLRTRFIPAGAQVLVRVSQYQSRVLSGNGATYMVMRGAV